jgi:hypothetical protein
VALLPLKYLGLPLGAPYKIGGEELFRDLSDKMGDGAKISS